MSLYQGLIGAQVELAGCRSTGHKVKTLARISKIFVDEIIGTVKLAPYAYHALKIHKALPAYGSAPSAGPEGLGPVYLARNVSYGDQPRHCMDIYVPAAAAAAVGQVPVGDGPQGPLGHEGAAAAAGAPVMVLCHGGVWAAGEAWHYAPLAAHLAHLGVIACVIQYTLYPEALVPQMVHEVSRAFSWVLDNVQQYGGDASKVSLVGHSAGAHLCQMALLRRAAAHAQSRPNNHNKNGAASAGPGAAPGAGAGASSKNSNGSCRRMSPSTDELLISDPRMPLQFIAICGVYDIAQHYVYEEGRGVHELSTMKRAMGGMEGFEAMSPAVILRSALKHQGCEEAAGGTPAPAAAAIAGGVLNATQPGAGSGGGPKLSGEAISQRIGFERPFQATARARLHPARPPPPSAPAAGPAGAEEPGPGRSAAAAAAEHGTDFPLAAAAFLPPTVLMSSCTDVTVPWYESAEMYWHLFDAGVAVKHLVYNKVGHGDFVVQWPLTLQAAADPAHPAADWGHIPTTVEEWGADAAAAAAAIADAAGAAAAVVSGNAAAVAAGAEVAVPGGVEEVGPLAGAVGGGTGFMHPSRGRAAGPLVSSPSRAAGEAAGATAGTISLAEHQRSHSGAVAGSSSSSRRESHRLRQPAAARSDAKEEPRQQQQGPQGLAPRSRKQQEALLEVLPPYNQDLALLVGCMSEPTFAKAHST